jgi:hypothetical protein
VDCQSRRATTRFAKRILETERGPSSDLFRPELGTDGRLFVMNLRSSQSPLPRFSSAVSSSLQISDASSPRPNLDTSVHN